MRPIWWLSDGLSTKNETLIIQGAWQEFHIKNSVNKVHVDPVNVKNVNVKNVKVKYKQFKHKQDKIKHTKSSKV